MEKHKFLVLRLSAAGDVLRTLPAVKALKENDPSSYVVWVVEEPSKALLESQPEVDEVILFPRRRWSEGIRSIKRAWKTAEEAWGLIANLRRHKFDAVFDFHGILKSGLLSFFTGSPKRVGFDRRSSREGNFLFSNIKVALPEEKISRYERNLRLLEGIGLKVKEVKARLHIPGRDQQYVEDFFETLPTLAGRPLIAIHPGTSEKTIYKRWMPDWYSQLGDRLVRELGAGLIFTWGPGEREGVEEIRKGMKEPSLLAPRTESLTQLGGLFKHCDLYVGGDTGPMHVASLMGIPVVVIYGPTDPVVNEPLGLHVKVRKEVGCNPCRKRSCKERICLKAVTVEDVFGAVKEALDIGPSSQTSREKEGIS